MTASDREVRRFRRLEEAFRALRDLPPSEREPGLARIGIEDPDLRAELEVMLRHDDRPGVAEEREKYSDPEAAAAGRFGEAERLLREIAGGPGDAGRAQDVREPRFGPEGAEAEGRSDVDTWMSEGGAAPGAPDRRVGPFRLLRELGVGASGVVHLAVDERSGREVALKLLHGLAAGPTALARFRREAAILRRLDHPGIATILDADAIAGPTGPQCYIAMEPVAGVPVTRWVAARGLGTADILDLLAEIADAVAHAHARGVVHRDLKPANVLVGEDGRPRVLDLGAARLDRPEGTRLYTETGQVIGTVPYMAPEQFDGVPERIGPPADVYALGVLGYRLLVGRLPLDLTGLPLAEAARIARDEEPSSLGSVDRRLRGAVSVVIGTALEKDAARRYPDAAALAADLRRARRAERVVARRPSILELAARAARRNRRLLGTGVAVVAILAAALAVAVTIAVSADRLRRQETASRMDAEQRRVEAESLRAQADAQRDEAIRQAAAASLAAAESALRAGEIAEARRQLAGVPPLHRGWTWDHLAGRTDRSDGPPLLVDDGQPLAAVLMQPDGSLVVASHSEPGRLHVVRDGQVTASWPTLGWVNQLLAGPAPGTVIVAGHRGVEVVGLVDGSRRRIAGGDCPARTVLRLPDGRTLLAGDTRGTVHWFDLDEGRRLGRLHFPGVASVHLLAAGPGTTVPDGAAVRYGERAEAAASAAAGTGGPVGTDRVVAVADGSGGWLVGLGPDGRPVAEALWSDRERSVGRAAVNPRGDLVASSWIDGRVQVRRGPEWAVTAAWPATRGDEAPLLVMADDSIVLAGVDAVGWWTPEGEPLRRLPGHTERPRWLTHLGGGRLVTVGLDGDLRRWDLLAPDEPAVLPHPRQCRRVAFLGDGTTVVTGGGRHPSHDGRLRLWDARDGRLLRTLDHSFREVHDLLVVPDRRATGPAEAGAVDALGAVVEAGTIDAPGEAGTPGTPGTPGATSVAGDAELGELIVAAGVGVAAFPASGGPPLWTALPRMTIWTVSDLGDGTLMIFEFNGLAVRIDLRDGSVIGQKKLDVRGIEAVTLPDGSMFLAGWRASSQGTRWARFDPVAMELELVRDLDRREPLDALLLPGPWGRDSGTHRPVAVSHADGSVQIVDPRTLQTLAVIPEAGRGPAGLAVLPGDADRWMLLVAGADRLLRFVPPGATAATESILTTHVEPLSDVAVSSDGRVIATASTDRTARVWHRTIRDRRVDERQPWPEGPGGPSVAGATPDRVDSPHG